MIEVPDIIKLLQHGFEYKNAKFGMNIKELKFYMGEPDRIAGNSDMGYWHYGFWRFGYFDGVIDQIAILFEKDQHIKFGTNLKNIGGEIDFIETGTKLYEIIKLFNLHGIEWSGQFRKNELDYATIHVRDGSAVTFDLDSGEIYRIAFRPPDDISEDMQVN